MTRKAILNLTARKKQDNMSLATNVNPVGGGTAAYTTGPAILTGAAANQSGQVTYLFPWCATARDLTAGNDGQISNVAEKASRTATTCFMVGLKESCEIQTNDGLAWQWRRICFTFKGPFPMTFSDSQRIFLENANGYSRVVNNIIESDQVTIANLIFTGNLGSQDYVDFMTAKVDTTRVTIKYDRTRTIAAGNESGVIRKYNMWHPMRKNLVYDEDETGATVTNAAFSTQGKQGMGDYYVIDMFRSRYGAPTTSRLLFQPQSTLYWHEK